jgi:hypothetical protein
MLKSRLAVLSAAAITIGLATVLTALGAASAPVATTGAAASSHSAGAANTAGHTVPLLHVSGGVHIVNRGLVKDCVYFNTGPYDIQGRGVNQPVTLSPAPGSCFNLYNKFTVPYGTTVYTGYEYQDLSGHCLWDNGGTIDVGAACKAGHPNEEFFGVKYGSTSYWEVGDITRGFGVYMAGGSSDHIVMRSGTVFLWKFPS